MGKKSVFNLNDAYSGYQNEDILHRMDSPPTWFVIVDPSLPYQFSFQLSALLEMSPLSSPPEMSAFKKSIQREPNMPKSITLPTWTNWPIMIFSRETWSMQSRATRLVPSQESLTTPVLTSSGIWMTTGTLLLSCSRNQVVHWWLVSNNTVLILERMCSVLSWILRKFYQRVIDILSHFSVQGIRLTESRDPNVLDSEHLSRMDYVYYVGAINGKVGVLSTMLLISVENLLWKLSM